jgi:predicted transcriptional regulator
MVLTVTVWNGLDHETFSNGDRVRLTVHQGSLFNISTPQGSVASAALITKL